MKRNILFAGFLVQQICHSLIIVTSVLFHSISLFLYISNLTKIRPFQAAQRRQVVERRINQLFQNHLCFRHQGTNYEYRDGSQKFGLFAFQPPGGAGSPREFHCT
jgi:hypothetical protein